MMNKSSVALCMAVAVIANFGVFATTAHAECGDPWVTQATMEYLHRGMPKVTDPECDINNYRGTAKHLLGKWDSYADLKSAVADYWVHHVYPTAPAPVVHSPPAPGPSKHGFNSNVPGCPTHATPEDSARISALPIVHYDKFNDGTPLPSCGGSDGRTQFKMVWLGSGWAKYGPSIKYAVAPAPPVSPVSPVISPPRAYQDIGPAAPLGGAPSQQGFNNNVPGCPTHATPEDSARISALPIVQYDKFNDGTPLPSCGGSEGHTQFKMVWMGSGWAKYGPSIHVIGPAPPAPDLAYRAPTVGMDDRTKNSLVSGKWLINKDDPRGPGFDVVMYNGDWYRLVASGGGNWTATLVASGGGNIIAQGGGNLISNDGATIVAAGGGNILLNGGGNLSQYNALTGSRYRLR